MDLEHNNQMNLYQDVVSLHQARNILSQNILLYLSNLNQTKSSSNETKDILIKTYKNELEKYQSKKTITESKTFIDLLSEFQKIRNGLINLYTCELDKSLKHCNEEHDLLSNLQYDTFKQINLEYYENCKQFKNKLETNSEYLNKEMINCKQLTDSIRMKTLIRNINKKLGDVFDYYSNDILKKVLGLSKNNFCIENQSLSNLNKSINISSLFNSIYNQKNLH